MFNELAGTAMVLLAISAIAWLGMLAAALVRVQLGWLWMIGWIVFVVGTVWFAAFHPSPPLFFIGLIGALFFPGAVGWRIYRSRWTPLGAAPGLPFERSVRMGTAAGIGLPLVLLAVHTYQGLTFRISGQLRDDHDRPVPRAYLSVEECPSVGDAAAECRATTADDGRFTIPGSPSGPVHLTVLRGKNMQRGLQVPAPAEGLVVKVPTLPSIRGTLADQSGKPKQGAILFLVPRGKGPGTQPILGTTTTEPDGTFLFDGLDPGKYWVTVNPVSVNLRGNWYGAATVPSDAELHLGPPSLRILGTIVNANGASPADPTPLAEALDEVPQGAYGRVAGRAHPDGTFEIPSLQPGRYRVWLAGGARAQERWSNAVEVAAGAADVVLELTQAAAPSGDSQPHP